MGPQSQQYWKPDQSPPPSSPPEPVQADTPLSLPVSPAPAVPPSPALSAYEGYDLTAPAPAPTQAAHDTEISWDASEYIHRDKGALWYVVFVAIVMIFLAIAAWLQAWTFLALIIVMAVAMIIYARRPPRSIHYTLSRQGLQVGPRLYTFAEFRAFGILPDGGVFSIMLLPTKRFMSPMTIYFAEEDGEHIVDILGGNLPMERLDHDLFDKFTSRIRF